MITANERRIWIALCEGRLATKNGKFVTPPRLYPSDLAAVDAMVRVLDNPVEPTITLGSVMGNGELTLRRAKNAVAKMVAAGVLKPHADANDDAMYEATPRFLMIERPTDLVELNFWMLDMYEEWAWVVGLHYIGADCPNIPLEELADHIPLVALADYLQDIDARCVDRNRTSAAYGGSIL